ncbi:AAA family ATPase [Nakamurella sp. YIM 132087]|uniref:AAA family ATPase n=1 Tax=Nakamurella alba TaxID=2665158 RepID=A0A7K1FME4_9ACTN|nr:LuxR family transcriptional regulator [Nakamurella alba]MTD15288.1 AAA family ATPase [Nakamurella alba]
MSTGGGRLVGRAAELRLMDDLLASVRDGMSGALVLVGEAGIGKTRLLQTLAASAADLRVSVVTGVESERHLAFAGLHRLLLPVLDRLPRLPEPQRRALESALGHSVDAAADRFVIGLGVMTLLADVAAELPWLCLFDDAHWLDPESLDTLAFVARRLGAESLGIVFGTRPDRGAPPPRLQGIDAHLVAGLTEPEAAQLLADRQPRALSSRVVHRLFTGTAGNPLALIALAEDLSADQLAGSELLPAALPHGSSLEQTFLGRIRELPTDTQLLVLAAAAAPPEEPALLWRALGTLGLEPSHAEAAEDAGVLTAGARIVFSHPLFRSAVYSGASGSDRRRVHRALAAASDQHRQPDHRAWHLARATVGHDEAVARMLEESAGRAARRGGHAAEASFLSLAAELTPEPEKRAMRLFDCARAHLLAGDRATAQEKLDEADPDLDHPVLRANSRRMRALLQVSQTLRFTGVPALQQAAESLVGVAPTLAREIMLEALLFALSLGDTEDHSTLSRVARAALALPPPDGEPGLVDLFLEAFATRFGIGYLQAVPAMQRAVAAARAGNELPGLGLAIPTSLLVDDLFDLDSRRVVLEHSNALERRRGTLLLLRLSTAAIAKSETWEGRLDDAETHLAESEEFERSIGTDRGGNAMRVELAAWRGDEADARRHAAEALKNRVRGTHWIAVRAMGILELSRGDHRAALTVLEPLVRADDYPTASQALPDLVEAAAGCGEPAVARLALDRLTVRALAVRTPWALGGLARSRALLPGTGDDVDKLFEEAGEAFGAVGMQTELARTRLLHGEWLAAAGRRDEARQQFARAHELFDAMRAVLFSARALAGLEASGGQALAPRHRSSELLTAQERQVAALAAGGATNAEIAAQLFVTRSTVEFHLTKVFRKLGLRSRRELAQALA